MVGKLLIGCGAFLVGVLLGPVLIAAFASFNAQSDSDDHRAAAHRLLSEFDDRYPQIIQMSFDLGAVARDCGYDERLVGGEVFGANSQRWTPSRGYFDLILWLEDGFRREVDRQRVSQLSSHLSDYELAFLDRCLRQTALAPLCGHKVRQVLEEGHLLDKFSLPSPFDQTRRTGTICAFLDGVAARNKQPLAQRPH
ncbi:MAG TPA: hypothetical protein VHS33_11320 [Sphingomicrobium sp.]|nr:hypothetical protein [Sphingomicrobium sp.]